MNDNIMKQLGFGKELARTKFKLCPLCGNPVNMEDFKDSLSRKEYVISGMCQSCQTSFFG
jgi:hypothetical protein